MIIAQFGAKSNTLGDISQRKNMRKRTAADPGKADGAS
jgi:hypothetical protein